MFSEDNFHTIVSNEMQEFKEDLMTFFKTIDPEKALQDLLNSLPYAAAILNSKRKAIFTNNDLLNKFGYNSVEELMGKRPGEILNCLHSVNNGNHCGVSENCKICGAMESIRSAIENNTSSAHEMKLTSKINGLEVSSDLKVTATPLPLGAKVYMLLYINDISHEKRRKALEKIFFHDVLNKISSLNGYFDFVKGSYQKEFKNGFEEHFKNMNLLLNDLTDEILAQRQLSEAENNELNIKFEEVHLLNLFTRVINQVQQLSNPQNIHLFISPKCIDLSFFSDITILNRVITNLLKNAVEASNPGESVMLNSFIENENIIISVHNNAYMLPETQLQIFKRSFSTKADNRGLGTYSIRLLTEKYLNGKSYFTSYQEDGTTFFIKLPVIPVK
jgi:hypothetical protein